MQALQRLLSRRDEEMVPDNPSAAVGVGFLFEKDPRRQIPRVDDSGARRSPHRQAQRPRLAPAMSPSLLSPPAAPLSLAPSPDSEPGALPPLTNGTHAPFDSAPVRSYLATLLPPVLGANPADIERTLFADPEFDARAERFAEDAAAGAVYIIKLLEPSEGNPISL